MRDYSAESLASRAPIGPLLGGYFTDHGTVTIAGHTVEGWRWVFYLNLPMGLIALFMVIAKMPKLSHAAKGSIDYLGAVLIVASCVPLLLALTFGGQKYAWDSPIVIGLLAMFLVCAVLFVIVEKRVNDPIIHMELFGNKVFTWANIAGFFSSMSFLSVVAFLPLFMQLGSGRAGHDQRPFDPASDDRIDCGGDGERPAGDAYRPLQAVHADRDDRAADCNDFDESDDLQYEPV